MTEASYANIPIVALSNIDSPTKFIDIAVPCNKKSSNSIGLMWWMLAREVLRLRGSISRGMPVSVDTINCICDDPNIGNAGRSTFEVKFLSEIVAISR